MAFISMMTEEEATGSGAAAMFDRARETYGYVPNHTRLFAHRPRVYEAWRQLVAAVTENMDERRYELATIAAARRLRSSYCTLAHGKVLADRFLAAPSVRDVVLDHRRADLDEVEIAVMDLAEKVVDDATSVVPGDIARLHNLGLSDAEIFEVVLAASARCFFSKTLDALCVQADAIYASLDPELRDTLTVGRPIASS